MGYKNQFSNLKSRISSRDQETQFVFLQGKSMVIQSQP